MRASEGWAVKANIRRATASAGDEPWGRREQGAFAVAERAWEGRERCADDRLLRVVEEARVVHGADPAADVGDRVSGIGAPTRSGEQKADAGPRVDRHGSVAQARH